MEELGSSDWRRGQSWEETLESGQVQGISVGKTAQAHTEAGEVQGEGGQGQGRVPALLYLDETPKSTSHWPQIPRSRLGLWCGTRSPEQLDFGGWEGGDTSLLRPTPLGPRIPGHKARVAWLLSCPMQLCHSKNNLESSLQGLETQGPESHGGIYLEERCSNFSDRD